MKHPETFEEACEIEGLDPATAVPDCSQFAEQDRECIKTFAETLIITRAANRVDNNGEEWIPDWDDRHEPKYEPVFFGGSSGFRLYDVDDWLTRTFVGSRLCFKERESGRKIVNNNLDRYRKVIFIKKTS